MSALHIASSQHRLPDTGCLNPVDIINLSSIRITRSFNNKLCTSSTSTINHSVTCSSSLGSFPTSLRATAVDQQLSLEDSSGVSYEALKAKLEGGEWEAADEETRRLLCVLAGEAAVKRKWVYFSEVKFIPSGDLQTLDSLWRQYSGGKFGYSVQRRIWKSVAGNWSLYFRKVGWTRPLDEKNDAYRKFPIEFMWDVAKPTPEGHLPLTNCLRGTQLLQEVLSHPAFDEIEKNEGMSGVLSNKQGGSSFL